MNKQEAIEILKIERDHMIPTLLPERIEAMDMAISALQAQDSKNRKICDTCKHYDDASEKCGECLELGIDNYEPKEMENSKESSLTQKRLDTIKRQAAIDAVDSETVSTNPDHFKSSEKFIKLMDDTDIASFGKWQWANGFNTALVATTIQLKKLPSVQSEIIHCRDCRYSIDFYKDGCCYCKRPSKEMLYIEEGYGFYCAGAERRTDD